MFDLRHSVVEGGEGTADYRDVHHVPKVPHEGPRVKNETLVQDLQRKGAHRRAARQRHAGGIAHMDGIPWKISYFCRTKLFALGFL